MKAWDKGPARCFSPEEGETYWQPQPAGGYVTLTMTPGSIEHDASACGFQVIPPGGRLPLQAHKAADKVWYVMEGTGELTIAGERRRLTPGCTIVMGRKVPHSVVNDGDDDLRFYFWITPPTDADLFAEQGRPRRPGEPAPTFDAAPDERGGLLVGQAAEAVTPEDMGQWVFLEPDEGEVYWQFPPAGGYIQWKSTTRTFRSNRFTTSIQVLPPGGQIPPHAHTHNEEWLIPRSGSGTALMDGEALPLEVGTVVFVDRWVTHSMRNDGDVPMELFVMFSPPGLDDALLPVSIPKSDEHPTEPDWEHFPQQSIERIEELFEGTVMAFPQRAETHNQEAQTPPVY